MPVSQPRSRRAASVPWFVALTLSTACGGSDGGGGGTVVEPTPPARAGAYTDAELTYFGEIAYGFEYGTATPVIRKWRSDVRVALIGAPTAEDSATVREVAGELTALIGGPVRVTLVARDQPAEVDVHFLPRAQFRTVVAQSTQGDWGQFWLWWDAADAFTRGIVLMGSDVPPDARRHLIREELTQALGLARDSERYPASIFYQGWSLTTAYTALDRALVEMLYREEVRTGLTEREVTPVLRGLTRRTPAVAARASRSPGAAAPPGPAVGMAGGH